MANCALCGRKLPPFTLGKKICQWCQQHLAAQRGEIADDAPQPVMAAPWVSSGASSFPVTKIFFGINIAVFVGMVAAGLSPVGPSTEGLLHWGANAGPYTLQGEPWRLVTCMFLHIGIIHLAFNMWCLWSIGQLCESLFGSATYAAMYLLCGLGASVTSVWWRPNGLSAGASGAIFGIAGALIAAYYLGEFSLPRFAIQAQLRSLLFFAGYNLFFGAAVPGIDNSAHIGGLLTGLALGAAFARLAPGSGDVARRVMILAAAFGLIFVAFVGVQHHYGLPFRLTPLPD